MRIGIYYEGNHNEDINLVRETLHKVIPNLECVLIGPLKLPSEGWDTFKGQFDVHYLLNYLIIAEDTDCSLWIVNQDIGDSCHVYLFGAAGRQKAIVSKARLLTSTDLATEACHEVGHLMGLGHCANNCCMKTSWSHRSIQHKNIGLCNTCSALLNH